MKLFSLLVLLSSLNYYTLAVNVIDNFADGNFTQSPSWTGDNSFFIINSAGELQSSGPTGGGTAALSMPYTCYGSMVWQFRFRLLFNPSSTNYARIYLYANNSILQQSTQSIYLKTGGESGTTDRLELWQQNGTQHTMFWSGIASRLNSSTLNEMEIKIQLLKGDQIQILSKFNSEMNWTTEGNVSHAFPSGFCWFGTWYTCTGTRTQQYFFDDFLISTGTPSATNILFNNTTLHLLLSFTQPMDSSSIVDLQRYRLLPSGTILQAIKHSDTCVQLISNLSQGGVYQLICTELTDHEGQVSVQPDTISFRYKPPIHKGDLIITEIMFDADPSAGLPRSEYIELYNNSRLSINTEGLSISDGSTVATLPATTIPSGEYILLIPSSSLSYFDAFTNVVSLITWPSLNNDADELTLYDDGENVLHRISYSLIDLPNDHRKDGGYSIESGNIPAWCKGKEIWSWSTNANGGTPGIANAFQLTVTDNEGPEILSAVQESSSMLHLYLNERTDTTLFTLTHLHLEPATTITSMHTYDEGLSWLIEFNGDTLTSYTLYVDQLSDCMGNNNSDLSTLVIAPKAPSSLTIEPSEILFNPLPYGADFIELYNNSNYYLDLKKCRLVSEAEGRRTSITLPNEHLIVEPQQYLALTSNEQDVRSHYTSSVFIREINALPPFPDDAACVWMEDSNGSRLFYFCYFDGQHQQLLKDQEGVSLERISFTVSENDNGNWTSSAATNNYATPGYYNSASLTENTTAEISIHPHTLEPGNSNHEKALINIEFHPSQNGIFVRCRIYNEAGSITRELMNNNSIGEGSIITWEGVNDKGEAVHPGLYLVYTECWNADGYYKVYKQWIGVH